MVQVIRGLKTSLEPTKSNLAEVEVQQATFWSIVQYLEH